MSNSNSEVDFSGSEEEEYVPSDTEYSSDTSAECIGASVIESADASTTNTSVRSSIVATATTSGADLQPVEKRGRKRVSAPTTWKKNLRKVKRNMGKEYVSQTGNFVPGKEFNAVTCGCLRKCNTIITEIDQKRFFESFWEIGDFSKQNTFLLGLVKSSNIKRARRGGNGAMKCRTFTYCIPAGKEHIRVCKSYFLKTLQISWGRLYRCLSKESPLPVCDARGKNTSANKIDDTDVVAHIKSFPAYQSHYSRKDNPERKYLNPDLNIRKMFNLYVEECNSRHKTPVKESFYYYIFSTKFNLHFKQPSTDTCKLCDELEMKIRVNPMEEDLKTQKELHLRKAEQARSALANEEGSHEKYVCTFDLQKALAFPKLSTSVAYYKRNMYMYNFGVHCINTGKAFMYMWDETEGGRGSQEIAACLIKHLKEHAKNYKYIVFYCDSCGGQNRNIKLSISLLRLLTTTEINAYTIEIKFMVSGHSFLPNDADFGVIEKESRKHQLIYSSGEWMEIVRSAKRKTPRYEVIKMSREDFLSTKILEKNITNRKQTIDKHNFSWFDIRWLRFEKLHPFEIKFKTTLNEDVEFFAINVSKAKLGRKLESLANLTQTLLYPCRRAITDSKKKDMLDLLRFIPPIHHNYYKNLQVEVSTRQLQSQNPDADDDINEILEV